MTVIVKHTDVHQSNRIKFEFGQLDQLPCPSCGIQSVSVYFDGPHIIDHQLWTNTYFFCNTCKKWDKESYEDIPPNFDARRDIMELDR